jgi:hypothetical protein
VLSWRIDGYLADTPAPPVGYGPAYESGAAARERLVEAARTVLGPQLGERAQAELAWPALIAALRRAENGGHDAAELLSAVASARELATARSVSEVLAARPGPWPAPAGHPACADGPPA